MLNSLRARLAATWLLSLAAACGVALLLVQLYRESDAAQMARAEAALAQGCERIAARYGFYVAGWNAAGPAIDAATQRDLTAVAALALIDSPGVAGGLWQSEAGAVATVFPTSPAPVPEAALLGGVRDRVAALAAGAQDSLAAESDRVAEGAQTLLLRACPLRGPIAGLSAFTLIRVAQPASWAALRLGLGGLLVLVLALMAALGWLVWSWTRHIGRIETALAGADSGDLPRIAPTGEAELDRIVAALNTAGARLAEARRQSAGLAARVAAAERLAALGRVAAGVAHEIRNPIAAMRLRAENALAGDAARQAAALAAILQQVARLDRLAGELLTMTQPRTPIPAPLDVPLMLATAAADHDVARVRVDAPPCRVRTDAALLRRALDALLENALRHSPPGATVAVQARHDGAMLRLTVADQGPGVPPDLRATLFEPFVTGRAGGTGLGLAIARELAASLGGTLVLADPGGSQGHGAVFVLEVPCPPC